MNAFTLTQASLLLLAGLVGGIIRGYSGFGFALAAMPLLNIGFSPAAAVPSVLLVECGIGLVTVFRERAHVQWRIFTYLLSGSIVGTPLGVLVLASAPADFTRFVVSAVALSAAFLLWRKPNLPVLQHGRSLVAGGFMSGLLNGGTALSGPPAILALLGSSLPPKSVRAILVVFILCSAVLGVIMTSVVGLQNEQSLLMALAMSPTVIVGAAIGILLFRRLPESIYRMNSLAVLALVSAATIISLAWAVGKTILA